MWMRAMVFSRAIPQDGSQVFSNRQRQTTIKKYFLERAWSLDHDLPTLRFAELFFLAPLQRPAPRHDRERKRRREWCGSGLRWGSLAVGFRQAVRCSATHFDFQLVQATCKPIKFPFTRQP